MPSSPGISPLRTLWASIPAILLLVLGRGTRAAAQEHPINWSLREPRSSVVQGKAFEVDLHADIPFGWHLYSTTQPPGGPTRAVIDIPPKEAFLMAGAYRAPDPDVAKDPNFGDLVTETYVDSATFTLPVIAKESGKRTLRVRVSYQTCTDRYCLQPTTDIVELPLNVGAGQALSAAEIAKLPGAVDRDTIIAAPQTTAKSNASEVSARDFFPTGTGATGSLPAFLLAAALMGALSLLTPCVFPMVPITVSYFTQRGAVSRGAAARQAFIYGGGIMATFTVLGMAIALLIGAGGINRFAANPWVNLLITGIFAAFALNLFGLYQVQMPSALLTRLDGASQGERGRGTVGILLMGLTFTLTSFTCTAPLVGTLLVMAAQGSWVYPVLGLLVFSAVFAVPFFLLALMPSALQKLPRAGAWLGIIKPLLGCIELAMAFKFLSNADLVFGWGIFSRQLVLGAWLLLTFAAVLLLVGAWPPWRSRPVQKIAMSRFVLALAALVLAAWLGRGLGGARVGELESFLPPAEGRVITGSTSVAGELPWIVNDYAGALALAKSQGKAVLIDFTGYTCTNCRWMEANMFPRDEVKKELGEFIRVRLYTDGRGEPYLSQQQFENTTFRTVALPLYAVMSSDGTPHGTFLGMTRNSAEFIAFLSGGRRTALAKSDAP